ncbi:MAG: enoyl-CoA hydratase/isomerase family protein [Paracoccaceae bacterium]
MTDPVTLTITDGIAVITLNQPDRRNALTVAVKESLARISAQLAQDEMLKAVILTGSGGVFCAGGDLKKMLERHASGEAAGAEDQLARMRETQTWFRTLRDLSVPVVTAVDGPAFGAGFGLALLGDFVLASERAQFCASFAKVGAVPDLGLMWSLPRVVGLQRARELFNTARTLSAEEACHLGIALEVHPSHALLPRAMDMAGQMAQASPLAFRLTKQISARAMECDSDTILELEAQAQAVCLTSNYHRNAISRFAEKKPPRFNVE